MDIKQSLSGTLTQLHKVLTQLSDEEYGRSLPILNTASVGQHTRHIIEFFQTLNAGYGAGIISYDKRLRNRVLETSRDAALQAIIAIIDQQLWDDRDILLMGVYSPEAAAETVVKTTYHRELVYNLEHTIHHMAMIRIGISQYFTVQVPGEFGVAAATIQYQKSVL